MQAPDNYAAAFAQALLDSSAPIPDCLLRSASQPTARRFLIYRNNVFSSLIDALDARFPVCRRLVGESFFRGLAHEYIRHSPPSSPVLAEYGADFPEFVSGFDPARELPYLPDVARLEYDIGRAYDAADATPASLEILRHMSPDQVAGLKFRMHPSTALHSSVHPIVSIWRTNAFDEEVERVDAATPEDALIVRPYWSVDVHRLPAGGFHFMRAIAGGRTLSQATAEAHSRDSNFDLVASIRLLVSTGAVAAIDPATFTISAYRLEDSA